jgi:hypothetical protein
MDTGNALGHVGIQPLFLFFSVTTHLDEATSSSSHDFLLF